MVIVVTLQGWEEASATVTDTADGGEADLYLNSRELEDELRDYVNTLPSFQV